MQTRQTVATGQTEDLPNDPIYHPEDQFDWLTLKKNPRHPDGITRGSSGFLEQSTDDVTTARRFDNLLALSELALSDGQTDIQALRGLGMQT